VPAPSEARPSLWIVAGGGLAATLIGNGIGRFAYTPLIPALIAAGWFAPAEAAYLAAANLAGYLVGALLAGRVAALVTGTVAIRWASLATAVSLLACAWPLGFAWFAAWRGLAGITGGILMVLAMPAVLAITPARLRGRAAGTVMTGVGLGIAAAGAVVPAAAAAGGVPVVWLILSALAFALAVAVWFAIPGERPAEPGQRSASGRALDRPMLLLLAAYACDALGFIPHTVFWVDYTARALGLGLEAGGALWVVFGLGAAVGPFLLGSSADRIGIARGYVAAMAVKAVAVALPLAWTGYAGLVLSSLVVGMLISGTSTLCSAWIAERNGLAEHRRIWGWMTGAFGVAQAGGAWAMSLLFAASGSHRILFAIGALALAVGAVLAYGALRLQRGAGAR